jgi:hypothetical protein
MDPDIRERTATYITARYGRTPESKPMVAAR